MNTDQSEPASEREVIITRVFACPARVLFEAYSTRENLMKWFGPRGWPLTLCEVDFRVGGRFRFGMTGPDGAAGPPFGGEYLEIVEDERIVYDNGFEFAPNDKMIVTVTFDEAGEETTLTIHTLFSSIAMKREHVGHGFEQGVGSGLDQLGELAQERARSLC